MSEYRSVALETSTTYPAKDFRKAPFEKTKRFCRKSRYMGSTKGTKKARYRDMMEYAHTTSQEIKNPMSGPQ